MKSNAESGEGSKPAKKAEANKAEAKKAEAKPVEANPKVYSSLWKKGASTLVRTRKVRKHKSSKTNLSQFLTLTRARL